MRRRRQPAALVSLRLSSQVQNFERAYLKSVERQRKVVNYKNVALFLNFQKNINLGQFGHNVTPRGHVEVELFFSENRKFHFSENFFFIKFFQLVVSQKNLQSCNFKILKFYNLLAKCYFCKCLFVVTFFAAINKKLMFARFCQLFSSL